MEYKVSYVFKNRCYFVIALLFIISGCKSAETVVDNIEDVEQTREEQEAATSDIPQDNS